MEHFIYNTTLSESYLQKVKFIGMWYIHLKRIAFEVVESITKAKDNEEINLDELLIHCKLKLILHCRLAVRISGVPEDLGSIPDNGTFFREYHHIRMLNFSRLNLWNSQLNCIAFEVVESITKTTDNEEINLENSLMHYKLKVIL